MTRIVRPFLAALAVAVMPLVATAQSNESGETGEVETVPGTDLAVGQPVENDGIGQTYVEGSHGDWEIRCIRTENGNDPCQLYQLLIDASNNPVAEINLFVVNGNDQIAGGATIVTPLETLLTARLQLSVDGGKAAEYPYSFCRTIGCFARIGLSQGEIDAFKAGNAARVQIVPAAAPDQTVQLQASLSGFTAGWNALTALSQAPAEQ